VRECNSRENDPGSKGDGSEMYEPHDEEE
jgi:hypothetical protein